MKVDAIPLLPRPFVAVAMMTHHKKGLLELLSHLSSLLHCSKGSNHEAEDGRGQCLLEGQQRRTRVSRELDEVNQVCHSFLDLTYKWEGSLCQIPTVVGSAHLPLGFGWL